MSNKKQEPEFVVTDRRRFSADDDQAKTQPAPEAEEPAAEPKHTPANVVEMPKAATPAESAAADWSTEAQAPPPPPSARERADGERAYRQSTDAMDEQLRTHVGAQAVSEEFKITFERVVEPFVFTAMMQLGLVGQEGAQRQVDIIGARQTIDTLSYLQEKTKGNLTKEETGILENTLYQLRMHYLEITNALARAVQNPPSGGPATPKK